MRQCESKRQCGVLLHISSLPGPGGVGDLGPAAHQLLSDLARAGQRAWQVLPMGPTGFGNSPYQLFSAFAGNPLFVSLEDLVGDGLLQPGDLAHAPLPSARADYPAAQAYRLPLLARAAHKFREDKSSMQEEFRSFCDEERGWLDDYALFMALKEEHGGASWYHFASPLRDRHPAALAEAEGRLAERLHLHRFVQWQFHRQWRRLREHAGALSIQLIGDMPIFVAHDSVDVWTARDQFLLTPDGALRVQAGVPPDYFSKTGQLWGNPLYDWERMAQDGYSFWRRRVAHAHRLFDRVRIDHFRGFCAHWEVAGDAPDATGGRWVRGPGRALFDALREEIGGRLDLILEDLGVITEDVEDLRESLGFPGMRVLQFAFGNEGQERVRPYSFTRNLVVYTSTHDNDTLVGWYDQEEQAERESHPFPSDQRNMREYIGLDREQARGQIHWAALRLCLSTVADLVIIPIQDVLGLPSSARMNRPGCPEGNWGFRLLPGQLDDGVLSRLAALCRIYGR